MQHLSPLTSLGSGSFSSFATPVPWLKGLFGPNIVCLIELVAYGRTLTSAPKERTTVVDGCCRENDMGIWQTGIK